jgi:hypothetical protein
MMHVMMVMMPMVVVVMMLRLGHGSRGGRRFLRDSVTGEADGESGRGDKSLDHERRLPFAEQTSDGSSRPLSLIAPELWVNRNGPTKNVGDVPGAAWRLVRPPSASL